MMDSADGGMATNDSGIFDAEPGDTLVSRRVDSSAPPFDSGPAPVDGGPAPVDSGPALVDGGPLPMNACPAGAVMRATRWSVFATPTKLSGDPWDGPSAGTQALLCSRGAAAAREAVIRALQSRVPGAGPIADRVAGEAFEGAIAEICGLVGDWLAGAFEGPELYAFGAFEADTEWRWVCP